MKTFVIFYRTYVGKNRRPKDNRMEVVAKDILEARDVCKHPVCCIWPVWSKK